MRNTKTPNEIVVYETYAEVVMYNNKAQETSRALIDLDDIPKITKVKWRLSKEYARSE